MFVIRQYSILGNVSSTDPTVYEFPLFSEAIKWAEDNAKRFPFGLAIYVGSEIVWTSISNVFISGNGSLGRIL